jgi:subtilisin-like proprotein convertase family protein
MHRHLVPILMIVLVTIATAGTAAIQQIPITEGPPALKVESQSLQEIRFEVEVGQLQAFTVQTPAGEFTRVVIPGFQSTKQEGAPELPLMNRLLGVPVGSDAQVEVKVLGRRSVDLAELGLSAPLFPAQPSMPKNADPATWPFVYDRAAYGAQKVSREVGRLVPQGRLRGVDLTRLELSPVEYYPGEQRLEVAERLEVRVRFAGADAKAQSDLLARTASPFFDPLYEQLGNGKAFQDAYPDRVGDVVTMVVVTPPEFESQLSNFIAWKTERGFHMVVGVLGSPEVGSTTASIQSWLHGLYASGTPELPAPSFVLFVGDVEQMPTFFESGDATDRPYCAVDADLVPDMYYGRFSATNSSQLQAILDKTLMYDQYTMPDPGYLGEVTMIAGADSYWAPTHANGQINYGTNEYFNAAHGITSHTYLYPESESSAAQIVQDVSNGVALVNYTAHGSETGWYSPAFTQSDINGLANSGKYCLAIGNCCLTSTYDYGECFGETFLRAPDKGAIGYIGGSNSTYWDEDFWWGVGYTASITANPTYAGTGLGAYDGLFHDHGEAEDLWYVTNDAIIFAGNLAVMEAGSSRITYYWNIYNLLGDPSLSTYLGVPAANGVVHPGTVFTTATTVAVEADPYSYVGLTQAGELVGAGTVDETGSLTLDLLVTPLVPGEPLHLVVTHQNRQPYEADLNVIVPATVLIDPTAIDANVSTAVTVTVLGADGFTPQEGIEVWAEGLDYATTPVLTDATGVAVVTVDYPYGPSVDIVGHEPGTPYELFREALTVNALALSGPDLSVTTDIGLSDAFALNLPGTLTATVSEPGAELWAELPDCSQQSTTSTSLVLTPVQLGTVVGMIAVSGYDIYREEFPVIEAYGTLSGTVSSGGTPLVGVTVRGYDGEGGEAFTAVTDGSGAYAVGDEILVASYTVDVDHFGYLPWEQSYFVGYGANTLDIELDPAPSGVLTGTISEMDTGLPLAATVKVYRSDTQELYAETTSSEVDGSYTTPSLPYFDYNVIVRAYQHVPVTIAITVDLPSVEKHFVLEPTEGDLLVIDDGAAKGLREAKTDGKQGQVIASAYSAPASKSASELATDLEALGYFVMVETAAATDPATWDDYDLIICSSGDNTSPVESATLRTALENHAAVGSRLLIEGGEVGYDAASYPGYPSFAENVLHVADWNHDESGSVTVADPTHYVMSVPNTVTGPISMTYAGYGDQDALVPTADAVMVGSWSTYPTDASVIAYDPNPAPEGGQIVMFGFNYAAMESAPRAELLQNAVNWLLTPEIGNCSVSGHVTLAGESDHSGIKVEAIPNGGSVLTDASGAYTLPGLYAGDYQIRASKSGWSTETADVTLADGQNLTGVDLTLTRVYAVEICSNCSLGIPDNNPTGISDVINVGEVAEITSVEVYVDITHTYIGDLVITLTSPVGTMVTLHDRSGGSTDDMQGWYPTELTPAEPLSAFVGEDTDGDWTIHVSDNAGVDVGTLNSWCLRITHDGGLTAVGDTGSGSLPQVVALCGSHPNPFNPVTQIIYELPRSMTVDLSVYDLSGQRVATLVAGREQPGRHAVFWNGVDESGQRAASGVYFYRLRTEDGTLAGKMMLVK